MAMLLVSKIASPAFVLSLDAYSILTHDLYTGLLRLPANHSALDIESLRDQFRDSLQQVDNSYQRFGPQLATGGVLLQNCISSLFQPGFELELFVECKQCGVKTSAFQCALPDVLNSTASQTTRHSLARVPLPPGFLD